MAAPIPLPHPFDSSPFRVRDARADGIGRGRLRGGDLLRPFHGVRSSEHADPERSYAPLLRPDERFSHLSAARLWGAPLPAWAQQVHVTARAGTRARSQGVAGHVSVHGETVRRQGLPTSAPVSLFLELAALLDLPDLVAVGDHLVLDPRVLDPADPRPFTTREQLLLGAAQHSMRGVRRARAAAELVRPGAESPMETRLRLLAGDAGLPEPALQYELRDGRRRVGWFDLAWPERRLIAEYDGDGHRTSTRQYERDIERFDAAHELGWHVVRVRAHGLLTRPEATRHRLRAAWSRA
jgi:hypothetical protein